MIVMNKKKCSKCGEEKDFYSYSPHKNCTYGLCSYCKECDAKRCEEYRKTDREKSAARSRRYYAAHKEKAAAKSRRYYAAHKEKVAATQKKYKEANKKEIRSKQAAYRRKKYANDPKYAFVNDTRGRMNAALGSGSGSGVRDLGCSVDWVMEHLASQFEEGWTWENRGKVWVVDHMFPLSAVDPGDRAQVKAVCNWRNLQPLTREENLAKSDKIYPQHQKLFDDLVARFRVKLSLSEATA